MDSEAKPKMNDVTKAGWTSSRIEEAIAVLWLIAGLVAWHAGLRGAAWLLFIKAGFDFVCAVGLAIIEACRD